MRKVVENQRKYHRPSMLASLRLSLEEGGPPLEAYAVNVSYGGLGLYTEKRLLVGTPIKVRISYMDGSGEEVYERVTGTVMWCRPVGHWYGVGIEFISLNPGEHAMLLAFLEQAEHLK